MDDTTHQEIRRLMRDCGVWDCTINMKVYTAKEFILEFGDKMPSNLKELISKYVSRLQNYFDERILEPI